MAIVEAVDRSGQDANQPGEQRAHSPHADGDGAWVGAREVGHGGRVDHRSDLEADLGVAQDEGSEHDGGDDAAVDDDLVQRHRDAEEVVDGHWLRRQAGR